jgi:membrane protein involved in colicin uptake
MSKIKNLYYRNIYAVIATLSLHLILVAFLLYSQIRPLIKIPEETVFVDFNTEIPPAEKKSEVENEKSQNQAASENLHSSHGRNASNLAVNDASKEGTYSRSAAAEREYDAEIKAAQQLVSDVNKNLSKKIPKIGDIAMPVDNTEGKSAEQVKQSNFKGKSNIHYNLANRYHISLAIPVYLAQGGGSVTVDIVVNRSGRVISANPRPNSAITEMIIFAYAKQAAEKTEFNSDPSAPDKQSGTISYVFVSQ